MKNKTSFYVFRWFPEQFNLCNAYWQVLVVMAAGRLSKDYKDKLQERAERLRNRGVDVYFIGIGREVKPSDVKPFIPEEENVFVPEDLDKEKPDIVKKIIKGNQKVSPFMERKKISNNDNIYWKNVVNLQGEHHILLQIK